MEHIYHRGKYRGYEWCKHLRPFWKQVGNQRWRRDAAAEIEQALNAEEQLLSYKKQRKRKKNIKVKFTIAHGRGFRSSYSAYYETHKQVHDAIRRNSIERITVFDKDGKTMKEYEKYNTK